MNFRMCLSVIIVFVFSLTLHAVPGAKGTCNGSAGPQGRERYVSPDSFGCLNPGRVPGKYAGCLAVLN